MKLIAEISCASGVWGEEEASSISLEDHHDFRNGARFLKGCLWGALLSAPLWMGIILLVF